MKTIYLHGALAKEFGDAPIEIDAQTPHMITRGLISRFGQKFKNIVRNGLFEFKCTNTKEDRTEYVHDSLTAGKIVDCDRIDFTPVVEGSGRFGQIIIGIVLIVVGVYGTFLTAGQSNYLTMMGVAMVVGGVAQLLIPVPTVANVSNERSEQRPSFLFNGAVNVMEQGGPVPLVYGRYKAGSVVVSAGFTVEQIPYNSRCVGSGNGPRSRNEEGPGCRGPNRGNRR